MRFGRETSASGFPARAVNDTNAFAGNCAHKICNDIRQIRKVENRSIQIHPTHRPLSTEAELAPSPSTMRCRTWNRRHFGKFDLVLGQAGEGRNGTIGFSNNLYLLPSPGTLANGWPTIKAADLAVEKQQRENRLRWCLLTSDLGLFL